MKVCVIGAGRAGTEAAREAARCGASVTLLDALGAPLPDWRAWPDLVSGGSKSAAHTDRRRIPAEVSCAFGTRVVSLGPGKAATAGGGSLSADAFVAATGSAFEPASFEGRGIRGVTILDSPGAYSELGNEVAPAERAVVAGEGARGMEVAERIATRGRRVTVLLSNWQHRAPGQLAAGVLSDAAGLRGVSLRGGRVERALGAPRLEALVAGAEVVSADVLAVAPRRVPRRVPGPAALGRRGGILVGPDMRATVAGIFSAGGCAELDGPDQRTSSLEDEQGPSGRVAGANATGSALRVPEARRFYCSVFGLVWACVGVGVAAARAAGVDAAFFEDRPDERTSCAIVYDRKKGTALGVEVVAEAGRAEPVLPWVGASATLRSLAYDGALGSSDISVVSETARMGLKAWSRC